MLADKRLFVSVRIDEVNPVHTWITVFTAHTTNPEAARGSSGQLCLATDAAYDFIERLDPVHVRIPDGDDLPAWVEAYGR